MLSAIQFCRDQSWATATSDLQYTLRRIQYKTQDETLSVLDIQAPRQASEHKLMCLIHSYSKQ